MWMDAITTLTPAQRAALAAHINAQRAEHAQRTDAQLVAYVVADDAMYADDLRVHLAARLPAHMLPARIVLLDALPLTPNGKVDRNALPDPDHVSINDDDASDFIAPRNAVEQAIAAVWRDLLGMGELSVRDNFFELGGHSLLVTRAVARLRETFNVPFQVSVFFEHPTIEGQAVHIGALQATQTYDEQTDEAREEIEL